MSWQDILNDFQQRAAATDAANIACSCDCPDVAYDYNISGGTFGNGIVYGSTSWANNPSSCGPYNTTYYWWDCYSGTEQGDKFNRGWSISNVNYFKACEPILLGVGGWFARFFGDPDHLDMTSVVIYEQCVKGKQKTKITTSSNKLEFTWSILHQRWTGPESTSTH